LKCVLQNRKISRILKQNLRIKFFTSTLNPFSYLSEISARPDSIPDISGELADFTGQARRRGTPSPVR
jgi:hypothetical protein